MDPIINSMRYLWAAYLIVAGSNIAVVIWLAVRWSAVNRKQS